MQIPFTLRIDIELKEKIEIIAIEEKRSINQEINKAIEEHIKKYEEKKAK